jgi:hypothetical protein
LTALNIAPYRLFYDETDTENEALTALHKEQNQKIKTMLIDNVTRICSMIDGAKRGDSHPSIRGVFWEYLFFLNNSCQYIRLIQKWMLNKLPEGGQRQKRHACMVFLAYDRPPRKLFKHTFLRREQNQKIKTMLFENVTRICSMIDEQY